MVKEMSKILAEKISNRLCNERRNPKASIYRYVFFNTYNLCFQHTDRVNSCGGIYFDGVPPVESIEKILKEYNIKIDYAISKSFRIHGSEEELFEIEKVIKTMILQDPESDISYFWEPELSFIDVYVNSHAYDDIKKTFDSLHVEIIE